MVCHPRQLRPSYAGRSLPNADKHGDGLKISQAISLSLFLEENDLGDKETAQYDGRAFERVKGEAKQHGTEEGSSTRTEEDMKGSSMNLWSNAASDRPTPQGLTCFK
ncbi:hypothetical protein V6N13_143085 [Hibiscus sabdariffa]|uniref:Uncharacterized protein n=1 Tax=Hibiscus sabdariffa TaxID=183260 RepID=A0ABR2FG65_9ROSI